MSVPAISGGTVVGHRAFPVLSAAKIATIAMHDASYRKAVRRGDALPVIPGPAAEIPCSGRPVSLRAAPGIFRQVVVGRR
jgi:hypothetical protein